LYSDKINEWRVADTDGTDIITLGYSQKAHWVDNNRVLLEADGICTLYDIKNKTSTPVSTLWGYIGKSPDGGIFFTNGSEIYSIKGDKKSRVAGFPWASDYIYMTGRKDTYTVLSEEQDEIYCFRGNETIELGKPGLFPNKRQGTEPEEAFMENTAAASDGERLAILQNGSTYLEVCILNYEDMSEKKLTLDCPAAPDDTDAGIKMAWLDKDRLAVFSSGSLWIVDTKDEAYLYKRDLKGSNTEIIGLLTK
jgi:hypothetical protein